jgi:hypothetical protein
LTNGRGEAAATRKHQKPPKRTEIWILNLVGLEDHGEGIYRSEQRQRRPDKNMESESAGDEDDRRYAPVLEGRGKAEMFGFPSPPRECFPSRDDRVAIYGFTVIYRNLPILGVTG